VTALAPVTAHVVGVQVIKTLIILTVLVGGFRVFGKREASQLNVYDLAMLMALANGVQNSMTGGLGNLPVGLATSSAILLAAFLLTRVAARRPRLEQRLIGSPTLLLNQGQLLTTHMRRQRISSEDLEAACRQCGLASPADAALAVLEVDGSISVVPNSRPGPPPSAPASAPRAPRRRPGRAGRSAGTAAPRGSRSGRPRGSPAPPTVKGSGRRQARGRTDTAPPAAEHSGPAANPGPATHPAPPPHPDLPRDAGPAFLPGPVSHFGLAGDPHPAADGAGTDGERPAPRPLPPVIGSDPPADDPPPTRTSDPPA